MREESLLLKDIPEPAVVQLELGRVLREATVLRRLLKIAMAEKVRRQQQCQASAHAKNERAFS